MKYGKVGDCSYRGFNIQLWAAETEIDFVVLSNLRIEDGPLKEVLRTPDLRKARQDFQERVYEVLSYTSFTDVSLYQQHRVRKYEELPATKKDDASDEDENGTEGPGA